MNNSIKLHNRDSNLNQNHVHSLWYRMISTSSIDVLVHYNIQNKHIARRLISSRSSLNAFSYGLVMKIRYGYSIANTIVKYCDEQWHHRFHRETSTYFSSEVHRSVCCGYVLRWYPSSGI